jgi:hypothetical protein
MPSNRVVLVHRIFRTTSSNVKLRGPLALRRATVPRDVTITSRGTLHPDLHQIYKGAMPPGRPLRHPSSLPLQHACQYDRTLDHWYLPFPIQQDFPLSICGSPSHRRDRRNHVPPIQFRHDSGYEVRKLGRNWKQAGWEG